MGLFDSIGGLAGNVIGGLIGAHGADQAAQAQVNAANQANQLQKYMYDTTRDDQAPWRTAGSNALTDLVGNIKKGFDGSSVASEPGYQFGLQQGQQGLDRQANAHGALYSGAALKAADRYNQDYAGTKYNEAFNRYITQNNQLANVAGLGQTANANTNQAGMNYANNASNNIIGMGNALGGASLYNSRIWGNAFNGAAAGSGGSNGGGGIGSNIGGILNGVFGGGSGSTGGASTIFDGGGYGAGTINNGLGDPYSGGIIGDAFGGSSGAAGGALLDSGAMDGAGEAVGAVAEDPEFWSTLLDFFALA